MKKSVKLSMFALLLSGVTFFGCGDDGDEKVAVTSVKITGTAVTDGTVKIFIGESATVGAEVLPSDATDKSVKWSSVDETIATVATATGGATITGVKAGETTVTVTSVSDGAQKESVKVIVSENLTVTSEDLATLAGTYKGNASIINFMGTTLPAPDPRLKDAVVAVSASVDKILWNMSLNVDILNTGASVAIPGVNGYPAKGVFHLLDYPLTLTKETQGATTFNIEGNGNAESDELYFNQGTGFYLLQKPNVVISGTISETGIDAEITINSVITLHYTGARQ